MPELRRDPLSGRWVSYAPERAKRPFEIGERAPRLVDDPAKCPFCPGKEGALMPATLVLRRSGSGVEFAEERGENRVREWLVKVVPNLYPAFSGEDVLRMDGGVKKISGIHEVMIDTPRHDGDPWNLTVDEIYLTLLTLRKRLEQLEKYESIEFASFGKNHGPNSGGSLRHPHTHIFATSIVPEIINLEEEKLSKDSCVICGWLNEGVESRRVLSSGRFTALAPWASREPYEVMVVPKAHMKKFIEVDDEDLMELSSMLSTIYKALKKVLGELSFNLILHTSPIHGEDFHWHLELIPRILMPMVVEVGLEIYVNTVYPEKAAEDLRRAVQEL